MLQEELDWLERSKRVKFTDMYKNARVVGAGSFGIVVACKEKSTNKEIALKIAALDRASPSQAAKSIMREQSILEGLRHPNLIRVYEETERYENIQVMRMELGRETLHEYAMNFKSKNGRTLPEAKCASIMKGLLQALEYLHD